MASKGIYKVIPSGVTETGRLRATLMLSPSVSEHDELANLPSSLVKDWRDERVWEKELRVFSVWVTGGTCAIPPAETLKKDALRYMATARSAKEAWKAERDLDWLDTLWASSMVRVDWKAP